MAGDGPRTLAFVADQDTSRVVVVDLELGREIASAELSASPGALLVSASGVVAVTLPERSQVQLWGFDGKSLRSRCAIATAAEPVAMALTPDARTLLVASAWGHALAAYVTSTLSELYRVELAREPRAVVVDEQGAHAFVSHGVGGALSRVELATRRVERSSLDAPMSAEARERLESFRDAREELVRATDPARQPEMNAQLDAQMKFLLAPERRANQGFALVLAPRGGSNQLLVPQVEVDAGRPDLRTAGYGGGNQSSVVPSIAVVDPQSLSLDPHSVPPVPAWRDPVALDTNAASCKLPRSAAVDELTHTLLVTCLGSDALVGYDVTAPSPVDAQSLHFPVASGPTGVAVDARGRRAVVWSQFERVLSTVALPEAGAPLSARDGAPRRIALAPIAGRGPSSQIMLGRRLFHAVDDPRIARDGRACASCHLDGRDDGLVWSTPGGPRRTKMLAGVVPTTAPYAWDGSAATLHDQIEGTLERLEGEGGLRRYELDALVAYVSSLPGPPRVREDEPDATIARGRELFASAETGCATCHVGESSSDSARHAVSSETAADATARFDTPSLTRLSGRAPYFHDGRFASLRELLATPGDKMGHTSQLSATDRLALEAFLDTL